MALYSANNELIVQQTGANNEAKPWFATGLLGKVTDFTTKSSKSQPEAVYASAKPTSVQVAVPAPTSMPVTGVAQTNDQRLVETWQKASKAERQKFMAWLAEQSNNLILVPINLIEMKKDLR